MAVEMGWGGYRRGIVRLISLDERSQAYVTKLKLNAAQRSTSFKVVTWRDGLADGWRVGWREGCDVGCRVGWLLGLLKGCLLGCAVG